jgi:GNAT superfamily N-acetyltransferase
VQPQDTICLDRGSYQVIRTASMPSYHWGNYLVLDQPPELAEIDAWLVRCWQELGDLPIRKRTLSWETDPGQTWPRGDQEPPREYQRLIVLAADLPPLPPLPPGHVPRVHDAPGGITFRPITGDGEWRLVPELSIAALDTSIPGYAEFVRWRYDQYARVLAGNPGHQWGAWLGDALVASLGLFSAPEALRFQEVQTHPEHRGRGICTALCVHALRHHMAAEPGKPAIIVAESGSQAERIYRRIGFAEIGWQHVLAHGAPGSASPAGPGPAGPGPAGPGPAGPGPAGPAEFNRSGHHSGD